VSARPRSGVSPMAVFMTACTLLCFIAMPLRIERFITPERGIGYWLGIAGGSAMVLLLIYPARKRIQWLAGMGSVKLWFQIHMVLGVVGPVLVLFHATFRTGATNSNVALVCMLLVAGSGVIGRYFYSRIHIEFHGSQATLQELRGSLARLQMVSATIAFIPDLTQRLALAEGRLLGAVSNRPAIWKLAGIAVRGIFVRRQLKRYIRSAARATARLRGLPANALQRQQQATTELAMRHLDAARRVAELASYERLFSLWHILHLPLFFMLLVAGIAHVIAVHIY
jgi:hypothetical protein